MRAILFFSLLTTFASAADLVLESPATRVHLLELYTSEGCSSCPPADAWLRGLKSERGLWRDFVPVAFHVNYWDNLGWPDRLASPRFTQRQRDYAARWRSASVYTPGFVLDGREWRERSVPRATGENAGVLTLRLTAEQAEMRFAATGRKLEAHLAWLSGDVMHEVKAGENRGSKLRHEFVALSLDAQPIDESTGRTLFRSPKPPEARAVAAWVTEIGQLEPLQAVGGSLTAP